jgi:hypothetical protein
MTEVIHNFVESENGICPADIQDHLVERCGIGVASEFLKIYTSGYNSLCKKTGSAYDSEGLNLLWGDIFLSLFETFLEK